MTDTQCDERARGLAFERSVQRPLIIVASVVGVVS